MTNDRIFIWKNVKEKIKLKTTLTILIWLYNKLINLINAFILTALIVSNVKSLNKNNNKMLYTCWQLSV